MCVFLDTDPPAWSDIWKVRVGGSETVRPHRVVELLDLMHHVKLCETVDDNVFDEFSIKRLWVMLHRKKKVWVLEHNVQLFPAVSTVY